MIKEFKNIACQFVAMLLLSATTFGQKEIVVAQDGSGNFKSIQEAINSLSAEAAEQRVIVIKKGTYREKIFLEKNFITLRGENKNETIIIISEARDIYKCDHTDDWGVATINLRGSDINIPVQTIHRRRKKKQ
jgi:pectinesterase